MFKTTGLVLDMAHQPTLGTVTLSGSDIKDFSPYANHGTPTSVTTTVLASGLAVPTFDGNASKIDCGTSVSMNPSVGLTIEAWVNPITFGSSETLIRKLNGYFIRELAGQKWQFSVFVGGEVPLSGTTAWVTGVFQHVVGTYDGANMRLYSNSVEDASSPQVQAGNLDVDASAVYIGARGGSSSFLEGNVAFLRIYRRALSATEIGKHFTAERFWFGV